MDEVNESDFSSFTLISTAGESLGQTFGSDNSTSTDITSKLKAGKEWLQKKQAGSRPWAEFFNFKRLSKPANVGDATGRFVSNIKLYYVNYIILFFALTVYCVVSNPLLLIGVAACLMVYWYVSIKNSGDNVTLLGRPFSPTEIYTCLGIIAIPVFYIAGVGTTLFWIIGVTVVLVIVHAVFMTTPVLVSNGGDEELGIVMEDIVIS